MSATLAHKFAWRFQFLTGRNPYAFRERLTFVNPFAHRLSQRNLLARSLRRDRDGEPYFRLNGQRLYFRPDFTVEDEAAMTEAVLLVLEEAYLDQDHYWEHVRVNPGDVVFDLGGHIGTSALHYARDAGPAGHVYSFEPVHHEALARNVRVNRVGNVTVVRAGVADRCGTAEVDSSDRGIDASIARNPCREGERNHKLTIDLVTLDDFVDRENVDRVDFVKMDVEGAEELVVRGAERTIRRCRPQWSIASYHTDFEGDVQHPKLVRALRDRGYDVHEVRRGDRFVRIFAW